MELNLRSGVCDELLLEDIGFLKFIQGIQPDLNCLHAKVLEEIPAPDQADRFGHLRNLKTRLNKESVSQLLSAARNLPNLLTIFPTFSAKEATVVEFKVLYDWLRSELELQSREEALAVPLDLSPEQKQSQQRLQEILLVHLRDGARSLRLPSDLENLEKEIQVLHQKLQTLRNQAHQKLREQYDLIRIPHTREMEVNSSLATQMETNGQIRILERNSEFFKVLVLPDSEEIRIQETLESRQKAFSQQTRIQVDSLNQEIQATLIDFRESVTLRLQRLWDFSLIDFCHRFELDFPVILSSEEALKLQNFRLPVLEKPSPLHLDWKKAPAVLTGANYSGKTTTLKSVLFALLCVKLGLPLPAFGFSCPPVGKIHLSLKQSGSVRASESSFTAEIRCLSQSFAQHDFILADELFQSTEPAGGSRLACLILEDFLARGLRLLTSSHYPDVLQVSGIQCLRMGPGFKLLEENAENAARAFAHQRRQTLKLAQSFSWPASMQARLQEELDSLP